MNVIEHLLRYWSYFRRGFSLYLSYPLTLIQTVVIVYSLALTNIPILKEWFPHMMYFAVFSILVGGLFSLVAGYWDFKKGSVLTDNTLMAKSNPVTWDSMNASILLSEAIKDFFDGKIDEGKAKIDKSIEIYKRWQK